MAAPSPKFLDGQFVCLFPCPDLGDSPAASDSPAAAAAGGGVSGLSSLAAAVCGRAAKANTMSVMQIGIFEEILSRSGATEVIYCSGSGRPSSAALRAGGGAAPPPQGAAQLLAVLASLMRRARRRFIIITESRTALPPQPLRPITAVTVLRRLLIYLETMRATYFASTAAVPQRTVAGGGGDAAPAGGAKGPLHPYATDAATARTIASDDALAALAPVVRVVGHEWLSLCAAKRALVPTDGNGCAAYAYAFPAPSPPPLPAPQGASALPSSAQVPLQAKMGIDASAAPKSSRSTVIDLHTARHANPFHYALASGSDKGEGMPALAGEGAAVTRAARGAGVVTSDTSACANSAVCPPPVPSVVVHEGGAVPRPQEGQSVVQQREGILQSSFRAADDRSVTDAVGPRGLSPEARPWGAGQWPPAAPEPPLNDMPCDGFHDGLPRSSFRDHAMREARAAAASANRQTHMVCNRGIDAAPPKLPAPPLPPLPPPPPSSVGSTSHGISNSEATMRQSAIVRNAATDDDGRDASHVQSYMPPALIAPMSRKDSRGEKGGFISIFFGEQHNGEGEGGRGAVQPTVGGTEERGRVTSWGIGLGDDDGDDDGITSPLSGGVGLTAADAADWAPFADEAEGAAPSGGEVGGANTTAATAMASGLPPRLHTAPVVAPFVLNNAAMLRQLAYVDNARPFAIQKPPASASSSSVSAASASASDGYNAAAPCTSLPADRVAKEALAAPNQRLLDELAALKDVYAATGDQWRSYAYNRAIGAVKRHRGPIITGDELKGTVGIGDKLFTKIKEILQTGTSSKLTRLKAAPEVRAIEALSRVWGIGPSTARRLAGLRGVRWDDPAFARMSTTPAPSLSMAGGEHPNPFMRFVTSSASPSASMEAPRRSLSTAASHSATTAANGSFLYTCVEDLRRMPPPCLTGPQRAALPFVEDLENRIPRAEVDLIAGAVVAALGRLGFAVCRAETDRRLMGVGGVGAAAEGSVGGRSVSVASSFSVSSASAGSGGGGGTRRRPLDVVVCGSYRRGKATSGDVDVLICDRSGRRTDGILRLLVEELRRGGDGVTACAGRDGGSGRSVGGYTHGLSAASLIDHGATHHHSLAARDSQLPPLPPPFLAAPSPAPTMPHHSSTSSSSIAAAAGAPFSLSPSLTILAELTASFKSQRESSCDTWFGIVQLSSCAAARGVVGAAAAAAAGSLPSAGCLCSHRGEGNAVAASVESVHHRGGNNAIDAHSLAGKKRGRSPTAALAEGGRLASIVHALDDEDGDGEASSYFGGTAEMMGGGGHALAGYVSYRNLGRVGSDADDSDADGAEGTSSSAAANTLFAMGGDNGLMHADEPAPRAPPTYAGGGNASGSSSAASHSYAQPSELRSNGGGGCTAPITRFESGFHYARRLDIKVYPADQFPFAVLYFTGSDYFNRSMRLYCHKRGLSLSDHGLTHVIRHRREAIHEGASVPCRSERDIFDAIGLPYRMPHERDL